MKSRRHEILFHGKDLPAWDAVVEQGYYRRIVHDLSAALYTLSSAHHDLQSESSAQWHADALKAAVSAGQLLRFQVGELVALHRGALSAPDTQTVAALSEVADTAFAVCEPWCIAHGVRLRMVGSDDEVVANRQHLCRVCVLAVLLLAQTVGVTSIAVRLVGKRGTGRVLISMLASGAGRNLAARVARLLEKSAADVGLGTNADWDDVRAYMILRTVRALAGNVLVTGGSQAGCVLHFLLGYPRQ